MKNFPHTSFPRYICGGVSGQFVMIKKVAEASHSWMKPLHVNYVTVFTNAQDYQGSSRNAIMAQV